jgi:ribose/xylose/arabinose/galactoside ABC-type transport system permease subunit
VSEKNTFKVRKSWDTAILALLFSVWVLASFTTDNFLSSINVSQIFSNSSEILIMGFAMIFLIITGEIDLSIASILALSSAMLGYGHMPQVRQSGSQFLLRWQSVQPVDSSMDF